VRPGPGSLESRVLVIGETVDEPELHRTRAQPHLAGRDPCQALVVVAASRSNRSREALEDRIDQLALVRVVLLGGLTPRCAEILELTVLVTATRAPARRSASTTIGLTLMTPIDPTSALGNASTRVAAQARK